MKRAGGGFDPCYNAQTAVDDTAHIIVAAELINNASDVRELPTMVAAVKDTLGAYPDQTLADAGYRSEAVFEQLAGSGIDAVIALGREGATHADIEAAARNAAAHDFIVGLPDGYDTIIDDEGGTVSAGEKQLLTIARAFLADPTILILDEATSSVDTRTEVLIQHAMAALRSNRTSFVIAHRLSTIRDADTILVMEHGHIVEQGDHDTLLAADGAYARLYNAQFAGAAVDIDGVTS